MQIGRMVLAPAPALVEGSGETLFIGFARARVRGGFGIGFTLLSAALFSCSSLGLLGSAEFSAGVARGRPRYRVIGFGFIPSTLLVGSGEVSVSTVYVWGRLGIRTGFTLVSEALFWRSSLTL